MNIMGDTFASGNVKTDKTTSGDVRQYITSSLYDLMTAMQEAVDPDGDARVIATAAHLLRRGRITRPRVLRERPSGPGISIVAFLVLMAAIGITRHAAMAMAQGAPAVSRLTASSYQLPHVPANVLDGSLRTRWSAHGAGAWIQYDMGTTTTLQQVGIAWYQGHRRRATFDIAVSTDAAHWMVVVYHATSSRVTQRLETYTFKPVRARYVRITGYGNSENQWNGVTELVIHAVIANRYQEPHMPANTLDGLHGTRWSAHGAGAWIQYDLRRLTMVQQAAIAWYRGNRRRAAFDIAVSTDAAHWAVVYTGVSSGKSTLLETYRFDPVQARYVRITGYGNSENQWNSLTEVVIHPRDPASR